MDEATVKAEARLVAIEYLLMNLYKIVYGMTQSSPASIRAAHRRAREMMQKETFPGIDAAQSDLLASEIQTAVEQLTDGIEEMMGLQQYR